MVDEVRTKDTEAVSEAVGTQRPKIKNYPGFGEITLGTSSHERIIFTALCMLNNPQVNQYLLDHQLKLIDNLTKTRIFPREDMTLPDGIYMENTDES